ncbi:MAG: hypothetical protein ABI811_21380 [Acidobacteriota bacterium]
MMERTAPAIDWVAPTPAVIGQSQSVSAAPRVAGTLLIVTVGSVVVE